MIKPPKLVADAGDWMWSRLDAPDGFFNASTDRISKSPMWSARRHLMRLGLCAPVRRGQPADRSVRTVDVRHGGLAICTRRSLNWAHGCHSGLSRAGVDVCREWPLCRSIPTGGRASCPGASGPSTARCYDCNATRSLLHAPRVRRGRSSGTQPECQ